MTYITNTKYMVYLQRGAALGSLLHSNQQSKKCPQIWKLLARSCTILSGQNKIDMAHHAEGLVDPKVLAKKTDFGYPRACRFRKYQKINRSSSLPLPTFFKT
jgi:hypothetical protein